MNNALLAVVVALPALVACTTVIDPPPQQVRVVKPAPVHEDRDKTAEMMVACDRLFSIRQGDGWRNCMMRGIDRYVDQTTPPLSDRYQLKDDCLPPCVPVPQYQPPQSRVYPVPQANFPHPYQTPDGGWVYPSYVAPMPLHDKNP